MFRKKQRTREYVVRSGRGLRGIGYPRETREAWAERGADVVGAETFEVGGTAWLDADRKYKLYEN